MKEVKDDEELSEPIWTESITQQHVSVDYRLYHTLRYITFMPPLIGNSAFEPSHSLSFRSSVCCLCFFLEMPLLRMLGLCFHLRLVLIRHCQHHYMWQHLGPQAVFTLIRREYSFKSLCERKIFVFQGSNLYHSMTRLLVTRVQSFVCKGKQPLKNGY